MAQIEAELGRLIRRFIAGQDRTPGTAAPETRDAQATPYRDTDSGRVIGLASGRQSNNPDRDATGSARRGPRTTSRTAARTGWKSRRTARACRTRPS